MDALKVSAIVTLAGMIVMLAGKSSLRLKSLRIISGILMLIGVIITSGGIIIFLFG